MPWAHDSSNNSCCGWGYSYWNCNWHSTTVVYHGGSYYGNAAWHGGYYGSTATQYHAGYNSSTGTYARGVTASNGYGTAARAKRTTRLPELMRAVPPPRTLTAALAPRKRTTHGRGPMAPLRKAPTPTGVGGVRPSRRTATQRIASIKQHLKAPQDRCKHPTAAKLLAPAVSTPTVPPWARPPMATNMRPRTVTQYKNTGTGWQTNKSGSWNDVQKPTNSGSWGGASGTNSAASKGWGGQEKSSSSAFSGRAAGDSRSGKFSGLGRAVGGGGGWGGRSGGGGSEDELHKQDVIRQAV